MARVDKTPEHIKLHEKEFVEEPFLQQLERLGWKVIRLNQYTQKPADSFRESFTEVIMRPKLEEALLRINPWLEPDQIAEVIRRITSFSKSNLIENNQRVLELLLQNTSVSENQKNHEKSPTVRYIDFRTKTNNSFIAVSQFKVRVLGTEHHIVPDITLFLNGLPIVVIECKSPKVKDAIAEAIDQLMRYSEQRGATKEGNQILFYYNQFLVSTCRNQAKFGTISTFSEKFFYRWTDPYPKTVDDLEHGASSPNDQQRLVQGMLDHDNLLSLIQTFTIFSTNNKGETIKIVGRYQQFRAVKVTLNRLLTGKNKLQRGGIIWHTQGSGKSLTMMFMVREMYRHDALKDWKIVFITDRTQLEQQLTETSRSIGFTVKVADSIPKLKELVSTTTSDLVMAMIHKFQEPDLEEIFPELNPSPKILIMTDEAHRSQYSLLGANLDRALPNATHIAYTGTPTEKTEKKYKEYIDTYTMRQSVEDEVTLEIVYEGRTHSAIVRDASGMDITFADIFSDYDLAEKLQILGYGSRNAYLEAWDTIRTKAADMVKHYIEHVFPNGFKAQVVATSREAAVRYKTAIDEALSAEIQRLEANNPRFIPLDILKRLQTAVVISGSHNDKPHIKPFTNETYHNRSIASFKLPFDAKSGDITGEVGIIIVKNMLLVGFDAPLEQVLYLDQVIRAHNLLQAIARVNRVATDAKHVGFVVDYVGVGHHLKEALDVYDEKEQQEMLDTLKTDDQELHDLIEVHRQMWELLKNYGIADLDDLDAFYDLFYDEDMRFEFIMAFKKLTKCLNVVFPRKEALDYVQDYKRFSAINILTGKHFRDRRMSMKGIPEKLRGITDEYLTSQGIDQKIPPISIIDSNFQVHVNTRGRTKTKAAEVEHAIRHFIDINFDEDPELYASFAETIEQILRDFKNNWEEIYKRLEELRETIKKTQQEPTYGLHRKKQMPFFRIFKKELFDNKELTEDEVSISVNLTQQVFQTVENELRLTGFWESLPAQNRLKAELQHLLLSPEFKSLPNIVKNRHHIISRIMELAKANNDVILYAE
jgi:type I restriction enzyme R subunit